MGWNDDEILVEAQPCRRTVCAPLPCREPAVVHGIERSAVLSASTSQISSFLRDEDVL